jgi:hypothetical protein
MISNPQGNVDHARSRLAFIRQTFYFEESTRNDTTGEPQGWVSSTIMETAKDER